MVDSRRPVLLYDSGCRLCRFAARAVVRLDRDDRVAVLPLDAPEAAGLLEALPERERHASWRLASPEGKPPVGRGAGATSLLEAIGRKRSARVLAAVPNDLLEVAYDLVANNRGRLGRLIPDGPAPRRYP